jgi:hypothetical protein
MGIISRLHPTHQQIHQICEDKIQEFTKWKQEEVFRNAKYVKQIKYDNKTYTFVFNK